MSDDRNRMKYCPPEFDQRSASSQSGGGLALGAVAIPVVHVWQQRMGGGLDEGIYPDGYFCQRCIGEIFGIGNQEGNPLNFRCPWPYSDEEVASFAAMAKAAAQAREDSDGIRLLK